MTPTRISALLLMVASPLIVGCASALSGVGGTDTFACKAPPGTTCTSVAGVYANAVANNLPSHQKASSSKLASASTEAPPRLAVTSHAPGIDSAIRSEPRVLRIWLAPWEDSEGDLHDQAYVYVTVDTGKWQIEHNRAPMRHEFAPLKLREQAENAKPSSPPPITNEPPSTKPIEPSTTTGGSDVQ